MIRVRCMHGDSTGLRLGLREDAVREYGGALRDPSGLDAGREYDVCALSVSVGVAWVYVCTPGYRVPTVYPLKAFEILDAEIPDRWCMGIDFPRELRAEADVWISFREWALGGSDYYGRLVDGDPAAMVAFERAGFRLGRPTCVAECE